MIYQLDPRYPDEPFPDVELALHEPDGLLALGGDLSTPRLLNAYCRGIFPWYNPGQPILWWSPDPRTVLFPEQLKLSRSLRKTLRKHLFQVSVDQAFDQVISGCAAPRHDDSGTWILPDMMQAYQRLHREGIAHSVEVWRGPELVGGLYGLTIGQVFFGESMFTRVSDASKVALVHLVNHALEWGYRLIDCQVYTGHLTSLGAESIPRSSFNQLLRKHTPRPVAATAWGDTNRRWPLIPGVAET